MRPPKVKPTILQREPMKAPEGMMTRAEVAAYLNVSLLTIYNWTKKGLLHPVRMSIHLFFPETEVKNLKKAQDDEK